MRSRRKNQPPRWLPFWLYSACLRQCLCLSSNGSSKTNVPWFFGEPAFFVHYGHFESKACYLPQRYQEVKGFTPQDSFRRAVFSHVRADAFARRFTAENQIKNWATPKLAASNSFIALLTQPVITGRVPQVVVTSTKKHQKSEEFWTCSQWKTASFWLKFLPSWQWEDCPFHVCLNLRVWEFWSSERFRNSVGLQSISLGRWKYWCPVKRFDGARLLEIMFCKCKSLDVKNTRFSY